MSSMCNSPLSDTPKPLMKQSEAPKGKLGFSLWGANWRVAAPLYQMKQLSNLLEWLAVGMVIYCILLYLAESKQPAKEPTKEGTSIADDQKPKRTSA